MNDTTDLMAMAESLVITNEPEAEMEADEVTLEEEPEAEEVEVDADDAEAEADEEEAEEASDDDADDEDDETEESDDDEELELEFITVKVDGEERQVTLDDLKRSYSGQSYIQKGMEENAKARKELEQAQETLRSEYDAFVNAVQQMQTSGLKPQPKAPDPSLAETDPIKYIQVEAEYRTELAEWRSQQEQIRNVQEKKQAQEQAQMQAVLQEQAKRLQERVPEFADPEKAEEFKGELVNFGTNHYGFSAEELSGIADARIVEVMADALRYQKLKAGKAQAKKKPEAPRNVKPVAKRGSQKLDARKKLEQKARRSGKIEDFVDLMLEG